MSEGFYQVSRLETFKNKFISMPGYWAWSGVWKITSNNPHEWQLWRLICRYRLSASIKAPSTPGCFWPLTAHWTVQVQSMSRGLCSVWHLRDKYPRRNSQDSVKTNWQSQHYNKPLLPLRSHSMSSPLPLQTQILNSVVSVSCALLACLCTKDPLNSQLEGF